MKGNNFHERFKGSASKFRNERRRFSGRSLLGQPASPLSASFLIQVSAFKSRTNVPRNLFVLPCVDPINYAAVEAQKPWNIFNWTANFARAGRLLPVLRGWRGAARGKTAGHGNDVSRVHAIVDPNVRQSFTFAPAAKDQHKRNKRRSGK